MYSVHCAYNAHYTLYSVLRTVTCNNDTNTFVKDTEYYSISILNILYNSYYIQLLNYILTYIIIQHTTL